MAFPNDSSRIARDLAGATAAAPDYTSASISATRSLIRKTITVTTASVLANGDNKILANTGPFVYFKNPARIMGVTVMSGVASSANILSYQTYSLKALTTAGNVGNTIANVTTQTVASGGTGNIVATIPFSLAFSAISIANSYNHVAANTWAGLDVQPTSSGVAVGAATWAIDIEEEGPDLYKV